MIRVNVAAAIVRDGKILAIEYNDETGLHYNLPGGGVEEGETLAEAVQREVREEAGVSVVIGSLLMAWEYVPARHDNRYGTRHKVGLIYEAVLQPDQEPDPNHRYDDHQTGVRWLPLEQLLTAETINYFGSELLTALHNQDVLQSKTQERSQQEMADLGQQLSDALNKMKK
jgi:8-oxo-dGTP pyrophosphatase MutT (NUDIX family)